MAQRTSLAWSFQASKEGKGMLTKTIRSLILPPWLTRMSLASLFIRRRTLSGRRLRRARRATSIRFQIAHRARRSAAQPRHQAPPPPAHRTPATAKSPSVSTSPALFPLLPSFTDQSLSFPPHRLRPPAVPWSITLPRPTPNCGYRVLPQFRRL